MSAAGDEEDGEANRLLRAAAAQLEASERRYRELAELTPALLFTADATGHIDFVNARWSLLTGAPGEALLNDGWIAFVHAEDLEQSRQTWRDCVHSGAPYRTDWRMRRADGSYRWMHIRADAARGDDGTIVRWFGSGLDVDEQRRAIDALAGERERKLRLYADIGEALSESLGLQETLDAVMRHIVPEYADWAVINLADENGDLRVAAIYHDEPATSAVLASQIGRVYARAGASTGAPTAMESQQPVLHERATYEHAASVVERDVLEVFWRVGFTSVLVVPLIVGTTSRGTLNLVRSDGGRTFVRGDLPGFAELARRIAPAIGNAERYERERHVAGTFQQAALPARLPDVPGYAFHAIYEAGRAEALVGGDWYDAFALRDGRIVISIGDVAGSGLQAAVTMANVRQTIRGVAQLHADPALILQAADGALRSETPDRFVTAFVGVVNPASGTLSFACAGHPSPYVREPDGTLTALRARGLPLGLREREDTPARIAALRSGALLVLYTDGLIESTRNIDEGEARLCEALRNPVTTSARDPAKAIRNAVLGTDAPRDDVAILTVRVS